MEVPQIMELTTGWCSTSGMLASVLGTGDFGEVHNLTNCHCFPCNVNVHGHQISFYNHQSHNAEASLL